MYHVLDCFKYELQRCYAWFISGKSLIFISFNVTAAERSLWVCDNIQALHCQNEWLNGWLWSGSYSPLSLKNHGKSPECSSKLDERCLNQKELSVSWKVLVLCWPPVTEIHIWLQRWRGVRRVQHDVTAGCRYRCSSCTQGCQNFQAKWSKVLRLEFKVANGKCSTWRRLHTVFSRNMSDSVEEDMQRLILR